MRLQICTVYEKKELTLPSHAKEKHKISTTKTGLYRVQTIIQGPCTQEGCAAVHQQFLQFNSENFCLKSNTGALFILKLILAFLTDE